MEVKTDEQSGVCVRACVRLIVVQHVMCGRTVAVDGGVPGHQSRRTSVRRSDVPGRCPLSSN